LTKKIVVATTMTEERCRTRFRWNGFEARQTVVNRQFTKRLLATWVTALAIAAPVTLLAAAPAVAASSSSAGTNKVRVIFNGSGTYTVDQGYAGPGGSCATHDTMSLAWVATFDTQIENGQLDGAAGSLAAGVGPGNASLQVSGPCADPKVGGGSCTAALAEPLAPTLSVSGTDPAHVEAQSLPGSLTFSGCSGAAQAPFLGSDLSTLEAALPDALTATASLPLSNLDGGETQTFPVSSTSAPGQVATSCTGVGRHGTGNTGCSATLSWSGTLTVSRLCHKAGEPTGGTPEPNCIDKKTKEEAAQKAKEYAKDEKEERFNFKSNCTGFVGKLTKQERGGRYFCAGMAAKWVYDSVQAQRYRTIADDPPESGYTRVAKPRSPHVKGFAQVRRSLPATHRLMQRYLKIAGLLGAVTTAQNRASGAYAALSEGNGAAAAALERQDSAELAFAKRAAQLLRGQHRLTGPAAAELRRAASRLHGRHAHRLAKAMRKFAARLASKRSARADKLAAAVLTGIGA